MNAKHLGPWLFLLVSLFASRAFAYPETATPVREADAICAKCHAEIFRTYLGTPMANASGLATERLFPGSLVHAPSGVEYRVSKDDKAENAAAYLNYRKPNDPAISGRDQLDYFLGSGHLGLTYLYTKNGYLLESPVAYYPDLKAYDMKPGLENMKHLPSALPVDSTCLRCHMSATQHAEAGTENRYQGLPFLHSGITCESCHGDTGKHVASRGKAAVVNPIKLDAAKRDSTCIVCHLEGATNVEHRGRSVLDYQPGQQISDYLSYFVYASEKANERGVSEIEQFTSSKCKRATGEGMSCMNCHDPHRSPAAEERVAFYRAKCLACHTQPKYIAAHHSDNPDCTSCHMPKTGAQNIAHVAWTDHRIRQRPAESESKAAVGPTELASILPDGAGSRDLALAYYDLAVKGDAAARPKANKLLGEAALASPDDPAVLRSLGILAEWNGDTARSQQLYRASLKSDPDSLAATTNLGTLLAKSGDLEGAVALWRPAFERNQDVVALGQNLATLECLLGNKDRAVGVLKRVLVYSPDLPQIRGELNAIETGGQHCPETVPPLTLQNP